MEHDALHDVMIMTWNMMLCIAPMADVTALPLLACRLDSLHVAAWILAGVCEGGPGDLHGTHLTASL